MGTSHLKQTLGSPEAPAGHLRPPAISVRGLRKAYGGVDAVSGVDFDVAEGEVFCFLGPNGAGKTTTVEILEGYRSRSAGQVEVLGADPEHGGRALRSRVGIVLQETGVQPLLTVAEALRLYGGYYPHPRPVSELVALVELEAKVDARIGSLSGGQRRRLDLALALAGDPELVFLDEPTTGFDPSARRQAWATIANLRALGKTIFLTTHYMDEAQHLADRVVVIAQGRIVAEGPPDRLGGRDVAASTVRFLLPEPLGPGDLPELAGVDPQVEGQAVTLSTASPTATLAVLCNWSASRGMELPGLTVERPSLEDVYLTLTATAATTGATGAGMEKP